MYADFIVYKFSYKKNATLFGDEQNLQKRQHNFFLCCKRLLDNIENVNLGNPAVKIYSCKRITVDMKQ